MEIRFTPATRLAAQALTPPVPAKDALPDWYKKMPPLLEGYENYRLTENGGTTATLKGCMPFLDALSAGYVYMLQADLEITKDETQRLFFRWRVEPDIITEHSLDQHPGLPSAVGGDGSVHKFHNDFLVTTPPGYSTYFTHPHNRHDLPFRTFSGVVDTDTYAQPVHFPFQMLDFSGDRLLLKKSTPVCQFFPFRRDSWEHCVTNYDEDARARDAHKYFSIVTRAYKRLHWRKKRYV